MPPSRGGADDPREWVRRARSNLIRARTPLEGVFLEDLCFDAQQAAEKALKAFLAFKEIPFPYVHDLSLLVDLIVSGGEADALCGGHSLSGRDRTGRGSRIPGPGANRHRNRRLGREPTPGLMAPNSRLTPRRPLGGPAPLAPGPGHRRLLARAVRAGRRGRRWRNRQRRAPTRPRAPGHRRPPT